MCVGKCMFAFYAVYGIWYMVHGTWYMSYFNAQAMYLHFKRISISDNIRPIFLNFIDNVFKENITAWGKL